MANKLEFDFSDFLDRPREQTEEEIRNAQYLQLARALDTIGRNPTPRRPLPEWRSTRETVDSFRKPEPEKWSELEKAGRFTIGGKQVDLVENTVYSFLVTGKVFVPEENKKELVTAYNKIKQIYSEYFDHKGYRLLPPTKEVLFVDSGIVHYVQFPDSKKINVSNFIKEQTAIEKNGMRHPILFNLFYDYKKSNRFFSQLIIPDYFFDIILRVDALDTQYGWVEDHLPVYERENIKLR